MTEQQIREAANNMIRYGGNFYSHLGKCLLCADAENQQKILNAWEKEITRYAFWLSKASNSPNNEQ